MITDEVNLILEMEMWSVAKFYVLPGNLRDQPRMERFISWTRMMSPSLFLSEFVRIGVRECDIVEMFRVYFFQKLLKNYFYSNFPPVDGKNISQWF